MPLKIVYDTPNRRIERLLETLVTTNIGRGVGNQILLPDKGISRHHARIISLDDYAIIQDLGSVNGTYTGEKKLSDKWEIIHPGEPIYLGEPEDNGTTLLKLQEV
tara:strand:+ start:613 stop:927 length:315 start_codon:yes stop_codon:yes gene_type:complete